MKKLLVLAGAQALLYGMIAWYAPAFAYGTQVHTRPILTVLALFASAFLLYALSIAAAVKISESQRLVGVLFAASLVYRALLLPTPPIQEIDIYRYLWDGAVTGSGLSPYEYAPAEVASAHERNALIGDPLDYCVQLCDSAPSLREVLRRIHYPELTTPYPPASQGVFALGHWLTPVDTSPTGRVIILKCILICFDLATIATLASLLKALGMHRGWIVSYAWCPLVIKEFANTGHLDSIAVFFSTAAVFAAVKLIKAPASSKVIVWTIASASLLSLAVAAKLYPLVVLPAFVAVIAVQVGRRYATLFVAITIGLVALLVLPMFVRGQADAPTAASAVDVGSASDADTNETVVLLPPPNQAQTAGGLATFLSRWEMNDFLFMVVLENIRPEQARASRSVAWFAVTPNRWRIAVVGPIADWIGKDLRSTSFLIVRCVATLVFLLIVGLLTWRIYCAGCIFTFLEAVFLILAWLWLLSPTQNPWYWIWAIPFLPFARGKAWYAVSGLVFAYYLRFWLQYHYLTAQVGGTPYTGPEFFDFIVVPLEFGPWMIVLVAIAYMRNRQVVAKYVAQE